MDLQRLFETQRELDAKILLQKGLVGHDLLDEKILALQVELGELANEQRTWKFWSHDQRPRGEDEYLEYRPVDQGGNRWVRKTPLLEEYVDCLHFILSIGNELGINNIEVTCNYTEESTTETFNLLFYTFSELWTYLNSEYIYKHYNILLQMFIGLGELHLGFTWEQIEAAYYEKNEINHARQENGY